MRALAYLSIILIFAFSTSSFADIAKIAREYDSGKIDRAIDLANHHKYKSVHIFLLAKKYASKESNASFEEFSQFLIKNDYLAEKNSMIIALESKLTNSTSASAIIKWFSHNKPKTEAGYYHYYRAAISKINDPAKLNSIIKNAWIYGGLSKKESDSFYLKHKKILTEDDNAEKISELLWRKKIEDAQKYFHLVGKDYVQAFKAWISILKNGKNSEHEFHKVKGSYKYISGLLHSYLTLHKKDEPNSELSSLFQKSPKDEKYSKEWWQLKNYYVRELIEHKKYNDAYKITSKHSNKEVCDIVDAEWISGWIALSFLKKPDMAIKHFEAVHNLSKLSISIARGTYWLGRSHAANKDKENSKKYYQISANYGYTYYGMLAQNELGYKNLKLSSEPSIHKDDYNSLANNPNAQIAHFLSFTGKNELTKLYSSDAFLKAKTDGEVALLYAKIAQNLDTHWKVEIAKLTQQAGTLILDDTYPTPVKLGNNIKNKPLVYAIMRQESVFDQYATSSANAYGYMQIIPPTAKSLSKELGIKFDQKKLLSSPEYNIKLGSYYLEKLMNQTGSYIKTAAHYNAGPVILKWDARFGDPRKMTLTEVINWVELIPYAETRNYVQRIIENMQIYRYILTGDSKLRIKQDLML